MTKPEIARDPTIEELLGSIRRAIHNDDRPAAKVQAAPAVVEQPAPEAAPANRNKAVGTRNGVAGGRKTPDPDFMKPMAQRPAAARPEPARQPAKPAAQSPSPVAISGSMRATRVSLEQSTNGSAKGRVTTHNDDFLALRERLAALTGQSRPAPSTGVSEKPKGEPARAESKPAAAKRDWTASAPARRSRSGFAGVLGGDVKLEEALARLSSAGVRKRASALEPAAETSQPAASEAPRQPEAAPPAPVTTSDTGLPPLRPAFVEDAGDDDYDDAAPAESGGDYEMFHAGSHDGAGDIDEAPAEAGAWQEPDYAPGEEVTWQHEPAAVHHETHHWQDQPRHWDDEARHGHDEWAGEAVATHGYREPARSSELVSREASEAASAAFNRLADTIIDQATRGERSMESITREVLKPMLKSWLDQNLPGLVEEIIREEITRIARRGRR